MSTEVPEGSASHKRLHHNKDKKSWFFVALYFWSTELWLQLNVGAMFPFNCQANSKQTFEMSKNGKKLIRHTSISGFGDIIGSMQSEVFVRSWKYKSMAVINRSEEVKVVNSKQNWLFADCRLYLPLSTPTPFQRMEKPPQASAVSVSIWYLKMAFKNIGGNMTIVSFFPQRRCEKHSKLKEVKLRQSESGNI